MSMPVKQYNRFTKSNPCPICTGHKSMPHGNGERCYGYISDDGQFVHCTREQYAGNLSQHENSGTFAHRWHGKCGCGITHNPDNISYLELRPLEIGNNGNTNGNNTTVTDKPKPQPIKYYDFVDLDGAIRHQTIRYEPKDFRQRVPACNGEWVWSLDGIETVLYKLPELVAANSNETVYIVEGEKDVDTLLSYGFVATCNPMGAKKWKDTYNQYLKGRKVVVIPDNDKPGHEHAAMVISSIRSVVKSVNLVILDGGKDVTEWFAKGHTYNEFLKLTTPKKRLYTVDELDQIPDPVWLFEPYFFSSSTAMVIGPSQAKKTFFLLDIALRLSETMPVIYAAGEGAPGIKRRVKGWRKRFGIKPKNFYLWPGSITPQNPEAREIFLKEIEHIKPVMLVIDTLARNSEGLDENKAGDIQIYLSACELVKEATGACVVTVHHTGWDTTREKGSSSMRNWVDSQIHLSVEGDLTKVTCVKAKDEELFEPRYIKWESILIGYDEERKKDITTLVPVYTNADDIIQERPALSHKIKQVLEVFDNDLFRTSGAGWKSVAEALGIEANASAKSSLIRTMGGLVKQEYLKKIKEGIYTITDKGFRALAPEKSVIDMTPASVTTVMQRNVTDVTDVTDLPENRF